MLEPKLFEVNEAWIAFRLNSAPVRTERDGDFNCIALLEVASCFLLASDLFPLRMPDADQLPIRRLLTQAKRHKQQLPKTLFVPKGDAAEILVDEALRQKIHVVSVPESAMDSRSDSETAAATPDNGLHVAFLCISERGCAENVANRRISRVN